MDLTVCPQLAVATSNSPTSLSKHKHRINRKVAFLEECVPIIHDGRADVLPRRMGKWTFSVPPPKPSVWPISMAVRRGYELQSECSDEVACKSILHLLEDGNFLRLSIRPVGSFRYDAGANDTGCCDIITPSTAVMEYGETFPGCVMLRSYTCTPVPADVEDVSPSYFPKEPDTPRRRPCGQPAFSADSSEDTIIISLFDVASSWLFDTGCYFNLIGKKRIKGHTLTAVEPQSFYTANGTTSGIRKGIRLTLGDEIVFTAHVLPDAPPVLSCGQRIIDDGWSFIWMTGFSPCLISPAGRVVPMVVIRGCPYLTRESYEEGLLTERGDLTTLCGVVVSEDGSICVFSPMTADTDAACVAGSVPATHFREVDPVHHHDSSPLGTGQHGLAPTDIEATSEGGGLWPSALPSDSLEIDAPGDDVAPPVDIEADTDDLDEVAPLLADLEEETLPIEDFLVGETTKPPHNLLTHIPADPKNCEICRTAKMKHRRKMKQTSKRKPEHFGELVTLDQVSISKNFGSSCLRGVTTVINILDRGTKFAHSFPVTENTVESVAKAIRDFAGDFRINRIYSDNHTSLGDERSNRELEPHSDAGCSSGYVPGRTADRFRLVCVPVLLVHPQHPSTT